jgi:putative Mn2+ efflux pump MntP
MTLSIYIAVLLITLGITADNLLLSKMSVYTIAFTKSKKALMLQVILFTIHLQVIKYGYWTAGLVTSRIKNQDKWLALTMLFSVAIKMIQEFKIKEIRNHKAFPDLGDFLNIALASSVYLFVLGFAFSLLKIEPLSTYKTVIPCLLFVLSIGLSLKHFNFLKAIQFIKITAIIMIFTGVIIFLINTI